MSLSSSPQPESSRRLLSEVRRRHNLDNHTPSGRASTVTPPPRTPLRSDKSNNGKKHSGWRWVRRILLIIVFIILAVSGVFGYKILAAGNKISDTDQSIIGQLKDLLFSSGDKLKGEEDGRINILLMAIGGEGHSGENLTDSIIVASIKPETKEVALLSIPRDLYVQVPGEEFYSKINAVHAYAENAKKGSGPEALEQKVEEITGLPIHYYGRVDFTAFKQIVDTLGGVTITIDNSFYDYWHKISFPAGTEKMDGERALAYVRARYVEGPEGGDFKRAARQQQVLVAIKDKIFSVQTAFDFKTVSDILDHLANNIRTDMQIWEMKRFFEIGRTIDSNQIHSVVLTTGPNGVLVGGTEILGGTPASILKTRTGDYSEIQNIAQNIFSDQVSHTIAPSHQPTSETASASPSPSPSTSPTPEVQATLEIRNGTSTPGLAQKTSDKLTEDGYKVLSIGNASQKPVEKTTVYVLKDTQADAGKAIAESLEASAGTDVPDGEEPSKADILIILGQDYTP